MSISGKLTIGVAALVLTVSTAGAQQESQGSVTVTTAAWSSAPTRWTVHPDGSIDDARGSASFAPTLPINMIVRHEGPAKGRFAVVARLLAPARRILAQPKRCARFHTDDYFGKITWSDGLVTPYSFGCEDADNRPVIASVGAANAQVKAWLEKAPVIRRYQITTSGEVYNP